MSRYKAEKFDFSNMSERLTFQILNGLGSYDDNITVWAHVLKDGFTRSENDNWFKIMVRDQKSLESLLNIGTRLKWKDKTLSIFSWQTPSYEDKKFVEILVKQIVTSNGIVPGLTDGDFFKDIVNVFSMTKVEVNQYGLISYEYKYNFTTPTYTGIKCYFSPDRNRFLDDKSTDVEHDSLIVEFNIDAPIKIEDYIISPIHGKFKVDMIVKNDQNILEAHCQRSEVQ